MTLKPIQFLLFFAASILFVSEAYSFHLMYDARKNGVEVFGPYVKYNFVAPPFSFGLHEFSKQDFKIKTVKKDKKKLLAVEWPAHFPSEGVLSLYQGDQERRFRTNLENSDIEVGDKVYSYETDLELESLTKKGVPKVYFCLKSEKPDSAIEFCSDVLELKNEAWAAASDSTRVNVKLNNEKVPKNAQVSLSSADEEIQFSVDFETGFKVTIRETGAKFNLDKLVVNPTKKSIGIISPQGLVKTPKMSFINRMKKIISEKNYFLEKNKKVAVNEKKIKEEEFEFANPSGRLSLQIFGVSLSSRLESAEGLEFTNPPLATYSSELWVHGKKPSSYQVKGERKGSLRVSKDGKKFKWKLSAPNKGEFNSQGLVVKTQKDSEFTHYRSRIFRGHQGSFAARLAVASSADFKIVPGFGLETDFWPEKFLGLKGPFYQRFGMSAGYSQTAKNLKTDDFGEKLSQINTHFNLMMRFAKGVRPIQSSFGLGLRYFNPVLAGSDVLTVDPQLLGVGLFWHTAPQQLVDSIVNIVPFFNYPKWMELAIYYYPVTMGSNFEIGAAVSMHARGRLMFSQNWFADATMNLHRFEFKKDAFSGDLSYLEGSFGIGRNF